MIVKGICETAILMISLFLIAMQIIELMFMQISLQLVPELNNADVVRAQMVASANYTAEQKKQKAEEAAKAGQEAQATQDPEAAKAAQEAQAAKDEEAKKARQEEVLASLEGKSDEEIVKAVFSASEEEKVSFREWMLMEMIRNPRVTAWIFFGLFALITIFHLTDVVPWKKANEEKRRRTLTDALLYIGCGLPFVIFGYSSTAIIIMNAFYTVILFGESTIKFWFQRKISIFAGRVILFLLAVLNLIFLGEFPFYTLAVICIRALKQIMVIAFSQIRLDVLKKIIRKTYAAEILLGLVLLVAAFSMILFMVESSMKSYGDALWFCFATLTTIGYGDITVSSPVGRVLGVILGIYGIVVVALITSIIVNFYNEMKAPEEETAVPEGGEQNGEAQAALPEGSAEEKKTDTAKDRASGRSRGTSSGKRSRRFGKKNRRK